METPGACELKVLEKDPLVICCLGRVEVQGGLPITRNEKVRDEG